MAQQNFNNYELKRIEIKGIELLPQAYTTINIYESLLFPAITGDINIIDWQRFNEVGEIYAGDEIYFCFKTDEKTELNLKFVIYASAAGVQATQTYQPVKYSFCSPWLIEGITRQISKSYRDKYIHEIIKDLLIECGASVGFIEPTRQLLPRFTSPLWTPIHTIHHLLSFAINQNYEGGYVFWTDLKTGKVNLTTMSYLYGNADKTKIQKMNSLPANQLYDGRLKDLNIEYQFDIMRSVNQGMSRTEVQSFNYDKNMNIIVDNAVNELPYNHLSTKLPVPIKYIDKKYKTIHGNYVVPISDSLVTDDNQVKDLVYGKAANKYARLFVDCIKLNALTNPNSSRTVGIQADIEIQSEDKNKPELNKMYSGLYLIRNIRHMIMGSQYEHAITFCCDGLKNSKNDLIKWGKI